MSKTGRDFYCEFEDRMEFYRHFIGPFLELNSTYNKIVAIKGPLNQLFRLIKVAKQEWGDAFYALA